MKKIVRISLLFLVTLILSIQFSKAVKYIALNPSNQTNAVYGGGTEGQYATLLVNQTKVKLEALGYTVQIFLGGASDNVPTAVNTWHTQNGGANAFVSMHTNGGGGSYSYAVYNKDHKATDVTLANKQVDGLTACLGTGVTSPRVYMWWNSDTKAYGNLGVLNGIASTIPCCVEEALFHDNPTQAAILKSSIGQEKIANGVANGIDFYFGGSGNPCSGEQPRLPMIIRAMLEFQH